MIANLALILVATLLLAGVIAARVGPVRLLAGVVAVPILWAVVAVVAVAVWLALALHS